MAYMSKNVICLLCPLHTITVKNFHYKNVVFLKCHHRDIEISFLYLIHCVERQRHNYCLILKTSIIKKGEVVFLKCHYRGIEILFLYLIHCIERQHHNYCLMLKTSIIKNGEVVFLKCHYRGIEILFLYLFPCI